MKTLLFISLLSAVTVAAATPAHQACGRFDSTYSVSPPLKVEEIERREMEKIMSMPKIMGDLPKVPFAYGHAEWLGFKSRLRPGDKIVAYSSSAHSWQHLAGEMGYAMMRGGCVIETFVTMRN